MPEKPPRVVCLGLCVLDEVLLVEDFGLGEARTRYLDRARGAGGMAAAAAAQAAALGAEAHLLSLVGDDADGRFVLRGLRARGVVVRRVLRREGQATTLAVSLVQRGTGERRFVVPRRGAVERGAPDFDLAPLRRGAVLLIDGHFEVQARRACAEARNRGVAIVGDFADARPAFRRLLRRVDHPVVPLEFVSTLGVGSPRETLRHLSRQCAGTPVVTLGARGALVLHAGRFVRVPAPRVRAVDTTGAGDAFHAAFAVELARGRDAVTAVRRAVRVAAASCRTLGGPGVSRVTNAV